MMKKMLTIATAALALSACGSDAPSVEEATPSYDVIEYAIMNTAWHAQADYDQHVMCGHWFKTPDMVIDLHMTDSGGNITDPPTVKAFFDDHCG